MENEILTIQFKLEAMKLGGKGEGDVGPMPYSWNKILRHYPDSLDIHECDKDELCRECVNRLECVVGKRLVLEVDGQSACPEYVGRNQQ